VGNVSRRSELLVLPHQSRTAAAMNAHSRTTFAMPDAALPLMFIISLSHFHICTFDTAFIMLYSRQFINTSLAG